MIKNLLIDKIEHIQYIPQHQVYHMKIKWKSDQTKSANSIIFIPQSTFYNVSLVPLPLDDNKLVSMNPNKKHISYQKLDCCSYILDNFNKTYISQQKYINKSQPRYVNHQLQKIQKIIQNQDTSTIQLRKNQTKKYNHSIQGKPQIHKSQILLDYDANYILKQFFKPYIINRNKKLIIKTVKKFNIISSKKIKI